VNQLAQFMRDWEPKSDTRSLPEFLEYLDYFGQANGTLSLEDDAPGDAVQLMTVPRRKRPRVFPTFPAACKLQRLSRQEPFAIV